MRVKFSVVPSSGTVDVTIFKNGVAWQNVINLPAASITLAANYMLFTIPLTLNAGDVIDVRYKNSVATSGQFYGAGGTTAPTASFELYDANLAG